MIPLTKYRWMNGYAHRIGTMLTTRVAACTLWGGIVPQEVNVSKKLPL
jgi:hypothetical protein